MKSSKKAVVVIAIVVTGLLLLLLGGGITAGSMTDGRSFGEFMGIWLPILLVVGCGILLFWIIPGKK